MTTTAPKLYAEAAADDAFIEWIQESGDPAAASVRFIAACLVCWPYPRAVPYQMLQDVIKEARAAWRRPLARAA